MSWNESEKKWFDKKIKNWDNLSKDKKLEILQVIENKTADAEGRTRRTVVDDKLAVGDKGEFRNKEPYRIYIDTNFLMEKGKSHDVLNTVLHEGRHAYQSDVVHGIIPEDKLDKNTKALKEIWKANNELYHGSKSTPFSKYRFQPSEDDANAFALKKQKELLEYLRGANKENGKEFLKEKVKEIDKLQKYARKKYGSNFKEKFRERVLRGYNRNVEIREYAKELKRIEKEMDVLIKGAVETNHKPSQESLAKAIEVLREDWVALKDSLYNKYNLYPDDAKEKLKEYNEQKIRDGQNMSKKTLMEFPNLPKFHRHRQMGNQLIKNLILKPKVIVMIGKQKRVNVWAVTELEQFQTFLLPEYMIRD